MSRLKLNRRTLVKGAVATGATAFVSPSAFAQANPIKIGFAMSLTGGLAGGGKQSLLGFEIWRDEINAKGGLLGRPVQLIHFDDQSNPANVPGLYAKLIDVDKVDLVVSAYATNQITPAMPVVMQKNMVYMGLFGTDVNSKFNYDRYFATIPNGPDGSRAPTLGFLEVAAGDDAEAADHRAGRGRRRIRADRDRGRPRDRGEARLQDGVRPQLSAEHGGLLPDRARGRTRSTRTSSASRPIRRIRSA